MTTIAYRDGVMACDSMVSFGGNVSSFQTKIYKLKSGAILGISGDFDQRTLLSLLDEATLDTLPSNKELIKTNVDADDIIVFPDGTVYQVMVRPKKKYAAVSLNNSPFLAEGSGFAYATGAMQMGASAKEAVQVACKWDLNSSEPVHCLKLKDIK